MERSFLLQRGKIDLETGRFPLTLFTNTGDASDGHVIHIPGLQVDAVTPMFVNHDPDPVRRMGSMSNPRKPGKKTVLGGASLTMDGRIDVEGDGAMADIRRDVAHGIHVGDITAMSGRWDPIKMTPRASLDKGHYAYSEIEGGWETPMFFEKARVLEGSIVGVPADAAAMIGRSQDLKKPEHVRQFYDVLVNGDPLSREGWLESVFADASKIERWETIECDDGKVYVPADVARAWGQSIEDEDATEDRRHAKGYRKQFVEEIDREQISLAGENDEIKADLDKLTRFSELTEEDMEQSAQRVFEKLAKQYAPHLSLDAVMRAMQSDNESTEPEPVSAPDSETTERDEPVSVPPLAATLSAIVALADIPVLRVRPEVVKALVIEKTAAETGYIA